MLAQRKSGEPIAVSQQGLIVFETIWRLLRGIAFETLWCGGESGQVSADEIQPGLYTKVSPRIRTQGGYALECSPS